MKPQRNQLIILVAIVFLAAVLRLWQLDRADVINDEAFIAFRSIGLIDFLSSPYQTTPWEWFSVVPAWAHLSFHDHPPLVFLAQYLSFILSGVSTFALRLPLALAGIVSVFLLYLIGRELFSVRAGLISAALLAVSSYHVWISRIGLQESMVIVWYLAALYLFLRAIDTHRHWLWGIAFGLALLSKYTALFLVPVFILIQLLVDRRELYRFRFWAGFAVATAVFSPVILYNIFLYQAVGHFDLQFSYLFGEHVSVWAYLPGKIDVGSFTDRVHNLFPAIYRGLLIPQSILFIIAALWSLYRSVILCRRREYANQELRGIAIIWSSIACLFFLLLVIGPTLRFTSMITPLAALAIGAWVAVLPPIFGYIILIGLIPAEIFFTYNTLFTDAPMGQEGVTYSYARYDSQQFGYENLNNYIEHLLTGKRPALSFPTKYQFLEDIKHSALAADEASGKTAITPLIIYDSSLYETAVLWVFHRQVVYGGWPVVTDEDFAKQGEQYWRQLGITDFYYVAAGDDLTLYQPSTASASTTAMMQARVHQIVPDIIKLPDGRPVFNVYHF